jgi:coenzyme PQQ precursor peptide PqqA
MSRAEFPGGYLGNNPETEAVAVANSCILTSPRRQGKLTTMQWTEPQFEIIQLGCEINSYASAAL